MPRWGKISTAGLARTGIALWAPWLVGADRLVEEEEHWNFKGVYDGILSLVDLSLYVSYLLDFKTIIDLPASS